MNLGPFNWIPLKDGSQAVEATSEATAAWGGVCVTGGEVPYWGL